jgi:hypothetical protein
MAATLLLRCSPVERELGLEVARELSRAGFEVTAPDLDLRFVRTIPASEATPSACILFVTRSWSGSLQSRRALDEARTARLPTWIAWWDEDAPSDFLGERESAGIVEILYLCLLPRPERIARLIEGVRAELAGR